jgi:outer membrane protein assembly factor BamD (BamD/ComL family)
MVMRLCYNARTQKAVSNLVELYTALGKQDEASRYAALLRNKEKD